MARLYSKRKGKHGSTRPSKRVPPSWMTHEPKVIEQLILKLAKSGHTTSQIGTILRDSYGVPDVKAILKKKVTQIITDNGLQPKIPEDLRALILRDIEIMKHLDTHTKDLPSRRGHTLTGNKIHRLTRYYKSVGKLPENWAYDKTKAKLLIE